MKKARSYLCLIILLVFGKSLQAQTFSYDKAWEKVSALEAKALPRSAWEEVKQIYRQAKKDKREEQVIRSLIYQLKYRQQVEDSSEQQNFTAVEQEIKTASLPASRILQSMLAEMYRDYLQQHRYQLYSRTAVINYDEKDISTWDAEKLNTLISALYRSSLYPEQLLQQIPVDTFRTIISKGVHTAHLRPTLYDLLAQRALDYFRNDESDITRPSSQFVLNDPVAFADAVTFSSASFTTADTSSGAFQALQLLQQLITFHIHDTRPDALIDADIQRLEFAYQRSAADNKDSLYTNALQRILHRYPDNPSAAQAGYLLAQQYYANGQQYQPVSNPQHQFDIREARRICEDIVQKFPQSEGGVNSKLLQQQILRPDITLQIESVNEPGIPFRTLVSYKNAPTVYFRIIRADNGLPEQLKGIYGSDYWKKLLQQPALKQWQVAFPDRKDYQEHAAEIRVAPLPAGTYMLIAADHAGFSLQNTALASQLFHVSNISYVGNQQGEYWVLQRETGQPLKGVQVKAFISRYNSQSRKNEKVLKGTYITDANGHFRISNDSKNGYGFTFEFVYGNDRLSSDSYQYIPYNGTISSPQQYDPDSPRVFLFTDRAIYRPGQPLYFKGIAVANNGSPYQWKTVEHYTTTVYLYNANNDVVDSLNLGTNAFGSYAASFRLPENLLNGQFRIEDRKGGGRAYFSVEEYKRPRFYIELKKAGGSYHLDDSLQIRGHATAYAGAAIMEGSVRYRVVRQARIIPLRYGGYLPVPALQQEIAAGETVTDMQGNFTVRFVMKPDATVPREAQPVFRYIVYADVTDINGETCSAQTSVSAGYQSVILTINTPDKLPADSLHLIKVYSKNLDNEFQPAKVQVAVERLQEPGHIFRERYWQQPDQFVIGREDYQHDFPFDIYKDENDPAQWRRLQQVINRADTTQASGEILPGKTKLAPGWYAVTATTLDKKGDTIRARDYVQVYDPQADRLAVPAVCWMSLSAAQARPGDKIQLLLGSTEKESLVLLRQENLQHDTTLSMIPVNNAVRKITIPVTAAEKGGIRLSYLMIKHNRVYSGDTLINVPWDDKHLHIKYATFRDKVLPGAREQWQLKITTPEGQQAAAEVLAAMYDASLDVFRAHTWPSLSDLYPALYPVNNWQAGDNFRAVISQPYFDSPEKMPVYEKVYDQLNWFGYVHAAQHVLYKRAAGIVAAPAMAVPEANKVKEDVVVGYSISNEQREADAAASAPAAVQAIRTNLQETAFFFPQLQAGPDGTVLLNFTMPEALTRWRLMTLAHTKDMAYAYDEKSVITQQQLMVTPNAPRFLREGDQLNIAAKIDNLSEKLLNGQARLQLLDALTLQPVDSLFDNTTAQQPFTVEQGQSSMVSFSIRVPENFHSAVIYRITAAAGDFSDGEENMLPVLSNRMLVTTTLPLNMPAPGTKHFSFDQLLKSSGSSTLQQYGLTVEFTSNPAWYAVQALPYLMESPHACADQVFDRYYANRLGWHIVQSSATIRQVLDAWRTTDTAALQSNLEKNQALKSVLLEATPWVSEAKSEHAQMQRLVLLLDTAKMKAAIAGTLQQLQQFQTANGGFSWFSGMPDDRYITQYIMTGIGWLQRSGIRPDAAMETMVRKALSYLDQRLKEEYEALLRSKEKLQEDHLTPMAIQYLYMRSFFPGIMTDTASQKAYHYYLAQSRKYWTKKNPYLQGMTAMALYRQNDTVTARHIIRSLKETASYNDEMGMYWKNVNAGYYWYQAPVETQSLLIAAFEEIAGDENSVNNMKTWLLKQKQTQSWPTTKATADACYALLLQGSNWLASQPEVRISLGDSIVNAAEGQTIAGTGYFQKRWNGTTVQPEMGNITVKLSSPGEGNRQGSWGAVYWQYFEQLDKIKPAATPLSLEKHLFRQQSTGNRQVLIPVTDTTVLHIGDKIVSRIVVRTDRDMEYVHLADMRSSCFEPVQVLSGYHWQDGAGYYRETKDAGMHFFFSRLPKGTFVLEYPMIVSNKGQFSNGISTIECMYAPEFSAHSDGVRVKVE